ncbi:MAG: hypothetical protein V4560_06780 [Bacteroidota bacterium]
MRIIIALFSLSSFHKKLIFISFASFFPIRSNAQQEVEHIDFNEFPPEYIQPNKIIKEDIYQYNINKSKVDSALSNTNLYLYNTDGYIVEQQKLDNKNALTTKNTYTYNSFNKIAKESNYYVSAKKFGMEDLFYEFRYDSIGRVICTYYYNKDTTTLKIVQKVYANTGQLIKTIQKVNNSKFAIRNVLNYDRNGQLSQLDVFDEKGEISYSYLFDYNMPQNTKNVYILRDGEKHFEAVVKYNKNGQILTRITNSKSNTPDRSDTEAKNRVDKFIYNHDGTINTEMIYINGVVKAMYKHFYKK